MEPREPAGPPADGARLAALLEAFRAGRRPALARVISLVEDERPGFEALLDELHAATGRAHRIGITGPPGAGKSTLTAALVRRFREGGERVGVVAVDPTSPFTGGALLGDRIRMHEVGLDDGVFIRSMASRGSLGGLAVSTKEVADVMDAFGFERILIETVGVGQSELEIAAAADTTVVVLVPESGDSIQAMKAGLMEIAELFVVNKADRPGAQRLARDIEMMLHLRTGGARPKAGRRWEVGHHGPPAGLAAGPPAAAAAPAAADAAGAAGAADSASPEAPPGWEIPVLQTVAAEGKGIAELAAALDAHRAWLERSGALSRKRRERLAGRVREAVMRTAAGVVWRERGGAAILEEALPELESGRTSPYRVAARIVRETLG
ncbi:MAG: methylmalonyl Co-A mutase-associated GTPase MeaB [Gemmatimonadetes bacterium]|nr:methylmalonyl Co-A mutase-associated GTPase MeaB [Gemmatimonadota bacterium]